MPYVVPPSESAMPGLVFAERITSQLQDRTIGLAHAAIRPAWRAVHIDNGAMSVETPEASAELEGPCVAWLPWEDRNRLRIFAGTVGTHMVVGRTLLDNAIGYKAESADLRSLVERQTFMACEEGSHAARTVIQCFDGMVREVRQGAASSLTVMEAQLRIMLIELWRSQGAPGSYDAAGNPSQRLMNRFSHLVEIRFREHWTVAQYAGAIGISADRLNDICRRNRGVTPKQLITARLATEARLLLENSTHSVEQIAGLLGFPSAAQFNRFFRNCNGLPPGGYRQRVRALSTATGHDRRNRMYEWP
jgi:AraC family transcriptional activator of pobA